MDNGRLAGWSGGVLGALAVGVICALAFPALKIDGYYSVAPSLFQVYDGLGEVGSTFSFWLALVGVIGAVGFTLWSGGWDLDPIEWRRRQAWGITISLLLTLPFPIYAQSKFSSASEDSGVVVSVSLGSGLILALLAFIAAAVMAWASARTTSTMATRATRGWSGDGLWEGDSERAPAPNWMSDGAVRSLFQTRVARDHASPPTWMSRPAGISLSPASGAPGTSVQAALTGFPAGAPITVEWATGEVLGQVNAWHNGNALLPFVVPSTACPGTFRVEANASGGRSAGMMFEVAKPVAAPVTAS